MSRLLNRQAQSFRLWLLMVPAIAACSCQPFYMPSLFHGGPAQLAEEKRPTTATVSATPHATPSESAAAAKTSDEREEAERSTPVSTPAKAEAKAPPQLAVVSSPAEQESARQRAEQSIDQAAKRLAHVDRSKLSEQDARDYDLIAGFVRDAQQALREQDFLKAEGLARKASVLATQLAARPSSPH